MADPVVTTEIPSLPIEEILLNVSGSVLRAQQEMDVASLETELLIQEEGLDQFGIQSHWYAIPELEMNLKLAFELDQNGSLKSRMVDAEYQSRYGFNVQGSSTLSTKIVSTPPADSGGALSLLDSKSVLKSVGRIKRIVEAYSQCDAPYFSVEFRGFSAAGYGGGLWYVQLLDTLHTGERTVKALAVLDDETEEVIRLLVL